MDDVEVGRMWDENAPDWIELSRAGYDVCRDLINTPAFPAMLPDVTGAFGLDLGCGEGHNTRLLAERCARVIGLEISTRFLAAASERRFARPKVDYIRARREGRRPFVIPRFPLTVSGWLNAAIGAGLVVEAADEPHANEALAAQHPEIAETRIAPFFLLLRARKP